MPKIKTYKSAAKRFKVTGSGKLVRTHIGKSHLRRRNAKRVARILDKTQVVHERASVRRIKRLAPYLKNS